jgi:hypothetical protein
VTGTRNYDWETFMLRVVSHAHHRHVFRAHLCFVCSADWGSGLACARLIGIARMWETFCS